MPRYTVHVRGEWLAVPCGDAQLTVGWLGREAVRRYIRNKPDNGGFASVDDVRFLVRRCKGLGLLDHEDLLEVALEDNEFVEVGERPEGSGAHPEAQHPWEGRSLVLPAPGETRPGCAPYIRASSRREGWVLTRETSQQQRLNSNSRLPSANHSEKSLCPSKAAHRTGGQGQRFKTKLDRFCLTKLKQY